MVEKYNPTYEELEKMYSNYFSMDRLNTDIGNKFALISLICYITYKVRMKNPDTTCYQVIMKLIDKEIHKYDMDFIRGLSIVCSDYMKNTTEFITFDLKNSKEMIKKIKEILDTWLPF